MPSKEGKGKAKERGDDQCAFAEHSPSLVVYIIMERSRSILWHRVLCSREDLVFLGDC